MEITKEFIYKNATIGLQRATEDNLVKRPTDFEGIEQYIWVLIDNTKSFKINRSTLDALGLDEMELWNAAERNLLGSTTVMTMQDAIGAPSGPMPMFVVTTHLGYRGAAAILDTEMLKGRLGKGKYVMLPSSIHEVILVPYESDMNLNALKEMVMSINASMVADEEQLGNEAYLIEL